jgi:trehalose 6-phosphate phosphatase
MNHSTFSTLPGVAERIRGAPRLLLGLDYDGTLTPIVEDPAQAFLPTRTKQIIKALSRRSDVAVAIVSGRAHADVQERVGIPGLIYASNHGIEISGPGMNFLLLGAKDFSPTLQVLASDLAKQLGHIHGAFIENKGFTLSVHYRRAAPADREEVRRTVLHAVELVKDRFQVTPGDKVHEIRPRLGWNKGAALTWIKEQLGKPDALVIYLGNDTTDEDVFMAFGDNAISIKINNGAAATAARYRLADPFAVREFLQGVHDLMPPRPIATSTN